MVADEVSHRYPYPIRKVPHRFTGNVTAVPNYDMTDGTKDNVGTEITLFLNEDCLEFANEYRAREVIDKVLLFHADRDLSRTRKLQNRNMRRFYPEEKA